MTTPKLFTPFKLGGLTLPNRIVLSPMGQHQAVDGLATDWHLMHLGQFAISGVGLVISESTSIDADSRISAGCLGIWSDEHARRLAKVAQFIADHSDAKFGVQLNHCGRKGSVTKRWLGSKPLPPDGDGWPIESVSSEPYPGRNQPLALTRERLADVEAAFANAARQCAAAGADLIEIHAAHGYLLHTFLSPLTNKRDDEFGGSLENRMRFPLRVFEAVRSAFRPGKAVGVRISATDWAPGGLTLEDSLAFCSAMKAHGCDYICVSTGGLVAEQKIPVAPLYQVPFSQAIRNGVGIPTVAVGLITEPQQAEDTLQEGKADLIALGRGLLREPRWPWRAAEHLSFELVKTASYR
jgi:2,4-dienoyl-CoA reductase-like NADH-dependent reductase (Old Yellow Enzyme family)